MRSNATKSRATTSSTPIKLPPRRSLALAAAALACVLASGAEAAEWSATAGGPGRMISGASGADQGGDDGAVAGRRIIDRSKLPVRHAKQQRLVPDHVPDEVLTLLVSGVSEQPSRHSAGGCGSIGPHPSPPTISPRSAGRFSTDARCRRSSARSRPNPSSGRPSPITRINWDRGLARPVRRATGGPAAPNSA